MAGIKLGDAPEVFKKARDSKSPFSLFFLPFPCGLHVHDVHDPSLSLSASTGNVLNMPKKGVTMSLQDFQGQGGGSWADNSDLPKQR